MTLRSLFFAMAFVLTATAASAQVPPAETSIPSEQAAAWALNGRFNTMSDKKEWEEIIAETTETLEKMPLPSAEDQSVLHFQRGRAYQSLGLLDEAATDFQAVVSAGLALGHVLDKSKEALDIVQRKCVARPPFRQDITVNGKILFTIFTDTNDIGAKELAELALIAANAVQSLTGVQPKRAVFMLFSSDEKQQAFEGIPHPVPHWPGGATAHGGPSGVYMLVKQKGKDYVGRVRGDDFHFTVSHEYMHVIVGRTLEGYGGIPMWMGEGMGEVAGQHSVPSGAATETADFRNMIAHNPAMTLEEISGEGFNTASFSAEARGRGVDPYAQSASMCNYLLLGRPPGIFGKLLQTIRQTGRLYAKPVILIDLSNKRSAKRFKSSMLTGMPTPLPTRLPEARFSSRFSAASPPPSRFSRIMKR